MLSDKMQKLWDSFSEEEKHEIEARFNVLHEEYLTLQEIRKHANITQEDIAKLLGIKQENVSRLERRKDMRLSTLNDYVEALGGKIQINAIFPNNNIIHIQNNFSNEADNHS